MISVSPKSFGVKTWATPCSRSRRASLSGMIPPTTTGTSSSPAAFRPSSTAGTTCRCEPDSTDSPTTCTSSSTAAETICAGVSRMPW